MAAPRRHLHFNPDARSWVAPSNGTVCADVIRFHRRFPEYEPTDLVSLPDLAREAGVGAVFLKNETRRCGLPSFKILGASWGTFRAITKRLDLPLDTTLDAIRETLASSSITIYAATDGNHGRAVARVAATLGLAAEIHVPCCMHEDTIALIRGEGARVGVSAGDYDAAVLDAQAASQNPNGILIQDYAFGDYQEVPKWIIHGYFTMMQEIDEQLHGKTPDLVVAPVGVGSFSQSVVTHFKQPGKSSAILAVEPDTAACLWKRLERGEETITKSCPTAMAGLDCATLSTQSWPVLQAGVDTSATVSDFEAHQACETLAAAGISAGPCGAASLAALRRLNAADKKALGLDENSTVVLLCTEGMRTYDTPLDVSIDDPIALTQTLVQINSASPSLGSVPGPGEVEIAKFVCGWLEYRDIDAHWIEPVKGRPSVVGVAKGSGGGKSLMLNGHIDTVTLMGYDDDPLSGKIENGKLYGRGSADMKCGVAAQLVAIANAKRAKLRGDIIVAAVADEEFESIGTEQVLEAGWRADAALVNEPTNMEIIRSHKGFVWFEVEFYGVAAHGSRPDLGSDAISKAGYFQVELDKYAQRLEQTHLDSIVGPPSVHASMISGGEEVSSYPASCKLTLERRTIGTETPEQVEQELRDILERLSREVKGFKYSLKATFSRPAFHMPEDHALTQTLVKHVRNAAGFEPTVTGAPYWTDCALLFNVGIPALLFGPTGDGFHGKEEWVDIESIRQVAEALTGVATEFCA